MGYSLTRCGLDVQASPVVGDMPVTCSSQHIPCTWLSLNNRLLNCLGAQECQNCNRTSCLLQIVSLHVEHLSDPHYKVVASVLRSLLDLVQLYPQEMVPRLEEMLAKVCVFVHVCFYLSVCHHVLPSPIRSPAGLGRWLLWLIV